MKIDIRYSKVRNLQMLIHQVNNLLYLVALCMISTDAKTDSY